MRKYPAFLPFLALFQATPAAADTARLLQFDSSVPQRPAFVIAAPPGDHALATQPKTAPRNNLADDFAALGKGKATAAPRKRKSAPASARHWILPFGPPSPFGAIQQTPPPGISSTACDTPPYRPNPALPAAAEQRRAAAYPAMARIACEEGVPARLFDALITQESGYNPFALSPKGAAGLTQLMPATARTRGVANVWNAEQNMRGGARELKIRLAQFGRYDLALAAYNAGPGRVRPGGTVPRIRETLHYVSAILATMQRDFLPWRSASLTSSPSMPPPPLLRQVSWQGF